MPNDIAASSWNEVDASNTSPVPAGYPEGWFPSDVNNVGRQNAGAIKRFWDHINPTATTAGTTTAYTLEYTVAPQQLWPWELFAFTVNATCGASPTLNINALGAKPLRRFNGTDWVALGAGDIVANQAIVVFYNPGSSGTYDIIAGKDVGGGIPESLLTTRGQMIRRGASAAEAFNLGASGTHLVSDGTDPVWSTLPNQVVSTMGSAVAVGTTPFPIDDTIPQSGEGTEFMALAITPQSATSKLVISVTAVVAGDGTTMGGALFQDGTAGALAATFTSPISVNAANILNFTYVMTSGTTSSTTFKFRAGVATTAPLTFNGTSGNRFFGGVMASSIVIRETA